MQNLKTILRFIFVLSVVVFAGCVHDEGPGGTTATVVPTATLQQYNGKMSDGSHYKGTLLHNKPHGFGTYIWLDGMKYVGQFKDGKKNGQGTHTWTDGMKYVGQFKDDQFDGQGTYTYPDGRKYITRWKNGKPDMP